VQNSKAIFLFVIEGTKFLLAMEHQKAFLWIRSMAQSGRDSRTNRNRDRKEANEDERVEKNIHTL
jgi:hypothetical protein